MDCVEYVSSALQAPRGIDEKTLELVIHDNSGTWTILRYETYVVIEKNGCCRVYDDDDVADVLTTELRNVARIEKWRRFASSRITTTDVETVCSKIRSHFEHVGSETLREACVQFKTKRGLLANTLNLVYDGSKVIALHRSDITIGERGMMTSTTSTFVDVESIIGFVRDHLSFRDDVVAVEFERVAKIVEIKIQDDV